MTSSAAYSISLTAIAFLTGLAILPVFARFSDKEKLLLAKRKIRAALYAFRLFGDEPRLVLRAQRDLLLWNARYLGLVLKPSAIVLLPILFLLLQMGALYGHRALRAGEPAIVSARLSDGMNLAAVSPTLTGQGAIVDTPAVRIPAEHRVFWRVRAAAAEGSMLALQVGNVSVHKSLQAGDRFQYLSEHRVASLWSWLHYPAERRLPPGSNVRSIAVQYPDADTKIFGLAIPWIVWFILVSWAAMFALRKRFGVVI